ncbi:MAG: PTS sugar transporter subunit IIC, partial [Clostridia bacterium]|nr:PTS sugar transporter subunit IIC [Clostridia bacterium]
LNSLKESASWFMAGLSIAGAMMRFVGFSILLKIMLANDMWGYLLAGFAMAMILGNIEATASAALILVAFIGIAIALLDFRVNSIANNASAGNGGMSDGI